MIFEQEYVAFEFFDALQVENNYIRSENSGRNFDAITFRYEADTVMEYGKKKIKLRDNCICYVPSNLDYVRISERDKMIVVHFKALGYHSNNIECFIPKETEKYRRLFEEILNCRMNRELSYKNDCAALLCKIFAELYKDNAYETDKSKISEAVRYINKNYTNCDFSLSEAAKKAFMSEVYFRKIFKSEFGMPPKKYVTEQRIDYAKALLVTDYYSIAEIAKLCGYNDSKHFSTEFKKAVGICPSKFTYNYVK